MRLPVKRPPGMPPPQRLRRRQNGSFNRQQITFLARKPTAGRKAVGYLQQAFGFSERRACRVVGVCRATARYERTRVDPPKLVTALLALAKRHPRYGYRFLHRKLRRKGHDYNHKRIYRLYREHGLAVKTKRRKRLAAAPREQVPRPTAPRQQWAMDFVSDHLVSGRRFRSLTVLDVFSRRCPGILVETSISGERVARFLDELAAAAGLPETIVVDNGPEFISNALDRWAYERGVKLHFIKPGTPTENAFIESFNGSFRNECLNANWFDSLDHARELIEAWRLDYNSDRPHSSLGGLTPIEYERLHQPTPTTQTLA
ncbi:MAG: IS3 family transposase [Kofleriaceae bacterium]